MSDTDKNRAYLCIGGPYDGRRYACNSTGFKAARLTQLPPSLFPPDLTAQAPVTVEHVTYIADCFKSNDNRDGVWFWRPVDQSLKQTLELLLQRYEQSNNIIWQETPFR